ncbi:MAG: hypothetical protein NTW29_13265 [Bacteroidetes bacterium]|nr:hypothetical protein [Bacteroidota bacterium]
MRKIILTFSLMSLFYYSEAQTNKSCDCVALTLNDAMGMKSMTISERADYLNNHCYVIGRSSGKQGDLTFKEFTKCNLVKVTADSENQFYRGDYTVKLWSDNSVQYTTTSVTNYQSIKKIVGKDGQLSSSNLDLDVYSYKNISISFQATTNKDGKTIYIIIYTF